jgi:hypothetical protein
VTLNTYKRNDMVGLWSALLPEVKVMEDAALNMNYPPKPSGLCVRYCPVKQCQFHGKGSRRERWITISNARCATRRTTSM